MMIMRKLFILFMLVMLALVACGGAGGDGASAPTIEPVDVAALAPTVDVHTVYALLKSPDVLLLDVREPDEYAGGHIPGITLIPMGEIPGRLSELPTDKPIIVTCRTGNRSGQVVEFLRGQGFTNVHNMDGGIVAWIEEGYETE